jgi:hypothetical protein
MAFYCGGRKKKSKITSLYKLMIKQFVYDCICVMLLFTNVFFFLFLIIDGGRRFWSTASSISWCISYHIKL